MKKFTREDVETVVDYFMGNCVEFTALDVRNELRNDGLYAIQSEVAIEVHDYMDGCAGSGYYKQDNGTYITYLPEDDEIEDEEDDECMCGSGSCCVNASNRSSVDLRFSVDKGEITVKEIDEWEIPINKVISFIYDGGTHSGQRRECIIKECLETRIVGIITDNDPSFSYNDTMLRNFSYQNMRDIKKV